MRNACLIFLNLTDCSKALSSLKLVKFKTQPYLTAFALTSFVVSSDTVDITDAPILVTQRTHPSYLHTDFLVLKDTIIMRIIFYQLKQNLLAYIC
jgi:hypothetical protein